MLVSKSLRLLSLGAIAMMANSGAANAQGLFGTVVEFFAGSGDEAVAVEASEPNVETQGPESLVYAAGQAADGSDDELLVVDPVRRRIVRITRDGRALGAIELDGALRPVDAAKIERTIYVLDVLSRQILGYDESSGDLIERIELPPTQLDLGGVASLTLGGDDDFRIGIGGAEIRFGRASRGLAPRSLAARSAPTPDGMVEATVSRESETAMSIGLAAEGGLAPRGGPAQIEITTEDFLAGARLIGRDTEGRFYVLVDTLAEGDAFEVRTEVRRFGPDGALTGVAIVPLNAAAHVPHRPVALADDGTVFALIPQADRVSVIALEFSPPGAAPRALPESDRSEVEPLPEAFEAAVVVRDAEGLAPRAAPATTRAEIIARAEAYLTQEWVLEQKNYERGGVPSICDAAAGRKWRRPTRLDGRVGETIVGLPYDWGGYVSRETFLARLQRGDLAGDVCTCRSAELEWCLVGESSGVDCSGFVSRAFGTSYYTTSRLAEVTERLGSWRDLLPGDIVNRPGRHVRLVTGLSGLEAGSAELRVHTIESAVSCSGMCAASYTVSELRGYQPRRYLNVTD